MTISISVLSSGFFVLQFIRHVLVLKSCELSTTMATTTEAHIREFMMDNGGQGPLKVPGFGNIPIFSKLPKSSRFLHGSDTWEGGGHKSPV